ncbi:heavy metal translocating P-type ATPase [Campylobacter ureolyticus]|uniref:Copper-transporting ATPase n=1 Tax=Campylobacter ureolyticus TaxID=827 RepID=A0AAE7EA23_9BACT|nr:cation-translocating P-type ATPase [Campylobacter ureolyticus]MCR8684833.1 cation-translocating P-type ATPase [Campylobacter ureolyticus]QKF84459.1 copper-translocating P-type ATPase [Campylobacter ureolyticus]QQY35382.1 cation-translocating P-type ATPase [Campylobacter ureolyticus]SUX22658.1 copper-translocating P-type ATPase [Campylobacter ureolyticus]
MSQIFKLNIIGMTCVNCSNAVEKVTKKIPGVKNANVSFTANSGEFEIENDDIKDKIIQKIEKLGYEIATNYEELALKKQNALKRMKNTLLLSIFLTIIIMILHMGLKHSFLNSLMQFILTTVVVFYCGRHFFIHAFKALKNRNFDMNVLVSLGVFSAYFYSTFAFLFPSLIPSKLNYVYFESAAMIITFISLGKFLEENSKAKADDYIKSLLNLTPKMAVLLKEDGTTDEVLATTLNIGDVVLVKNGMTIPRDGVIVDGGAEIDTSILTGESLPIYKKVGDSVNAGSLNTNGVISIKITTQNHETLLFRMTKLLSEASAKKMPISRFADRIANIFVPIVILISLVTFLVWFLLGNLGYAVVCAISVLVISCPCALGLATPIAIVCSISNLAKKGVLVKNPEVLEILKDTKNVIFDKTGTLTSGKIEVYKTNLSDEIFSKVASLEVLNEHLIAKAIIKYAKENDIKFDKFNGKFENLVGNGLKTDNLIIGNENLLLENDIKFEKKEFEYFLDKGFGVVLVAVDGKYKGYIALNDRVKSHSKEIIDKLNNASINTIMLTGDNQKVADFVASNLKIKEVFSQILPEQKFEIVKKQKENGVTVFIGDGVNDALSLKEANCGVAMNSGSDIAKSSGDILIINNDLNGILKLIKTSDKTMNIIKQNLFWAFFYNALCIPLAAGVFASFGLLLSPAYAALAMSFSSVSVVLNSLRLKLW